MKRAILIATGTVGGLGAVLAITPPAFVSHTPTPLALPSASTAAGVAAAPVQSAAPTATKSASASKLGTATKPTATKSAAATQAPTQPAAPAGVTGTFIGDVVNVRYGNVQVKITVANGKITDAQAVQAPSGRNDRWTQMAVPILHQQTLQAQSAAINGASGASFTSYGWQTSLVSALAKAGL
jgi:uncharacterized protein with FMN-binding domain